MNDASELLIYTDLDGTLLDHYSYSFESARPLIDFLNSESIPWILNTSKTLAELSELRIALNNSHPMIVENGGGIAIPADHPMANQIIASQPGSGQLKSGQPKSGQPKSGQLKSDQPKSGQPKSGQPATALGNDGANAGFHLITLGATRTAILDALAPLRHQFAFRSCNELTAEQFSEITGLGITQARQAMDRQFSEPLIWQDSAAKLALFTANLHQHGLSLLRGGRFMHVIGNSDKGKAMAWLSTHWPQSNRSITTVALGDGENDVAMLLQADFPVIVRSPVHEPPLVKHHRPILLTHLTGPAGWAEALIGLLNEFGYTLPKDASSADVNSADVNSTDVNSTDVNSTDVNSTTTSSEGGKQT